MGQTPNSLMGNAFSAQDLYGSLAASDSDESSHPCLDSAQATLPTTSEPGFLRNTNPARSLCLKALPGSGDCGAPRALATPAGLKALHRAPSPGLMPNSHLPTFLFQISTYSLHVEACYLFIFPFPTKIASKTCC